MFPTHNFLLSRFDESKISFMHIVYIHSMVSWVLFDFSLFSSFLLFYFLSQVNTHMTKRMHVLFSFPLHLLCLSPILIFLGYIKERAHFMLPEVFLITTGAETAMQAGGLLTVLATLFR